jgi:hypothetical protein
MIKSESRNYFLKNYFLLMFISPVIALAVAIKHASAKNLTLVTKLFFTFFGALYYYGSDGADGIKHLQSVRDYYIGMSFATFFTDCLDLLLLNPKPYANDVYKHVLSFIAGFFNFPELIHLLAGLVLGYYFSQSMYLLYKSKGSFNVSIYVIFFLVIFVTTRTLIGLNSIRMWTGLWVLFYYSISYWNKKSVFNLVALVIIPLFFHFSYAIFVLPILASIFLRKFRLFVVLLYVISFSFSFNFTAIQSFLPQDNELFEKKSGYVQTDDRIEQNKIAHKKNNENSDLFVTLGTSIYRSHSIPFLCILIIYFLFMNKKDDLINFLLVSGLVMLTFSNVVGFSPSISGRTFTIASTYLLAGSLLVMRTLYNVDSNLAKSWRLGSVVFFIISAPFLFYNIVFILRIVSAFLLFLPAVSIFIGDSDISIRDFIVQIF